jgi:hypothetical protein
VVIGVSEWWMEIITDNREKSTPKLGCTVDPNEAVVLVGSRMTKNEAHS